MSHPAHSGLTGRGRAGEPYDLQRFGTCDQCGTGFITTQGGIVTRQECCCGAINETIGPKLKVCPECQERWCVCRKVPT